MEFNFKMFIFHCNFNLIYYLIQANYYYIVNCEFFKILYSCALPPNSCKIGELSILTYLFKQMYLFRISWAELGALDLIWNQLDCKILFPHILISNFSDNLLSCTSFVIPHTAWNK